MLPGQASLVAFPVRADVIHVAEREVEDGLLDHLVSTFFPHALGAAA